MVRVPSTLSALGTTLVLAAGLAASSAAFAQTPSPDDIVRALSPKPLTRSLSAAPAPPPVNSADAAFIQSLQTRTSRSLSQDDRSKLAAISATRPSIDLEIPFDFNSSSISATTKPAVDRLGQALTDPSLRAGTFMIAGHTDAKGKAAFNQGLSDRRAAAVKGYIAQNYGLSASNMIAVGYGSTRLKNTSDPIGPENRRVEVTNLSDVKSASQ